MNSNHSLSFLTCLQTNTFHCHFIHLWVKLLLALKTVTHTFALQILKFLSGINKANLGLKLTQVALPTKSWHKSFLENRCEIVKFCWHRSYSSGFELIQVCFRTWINKCPISYFQVQVEGEKERDEVVHLLEVNLLAFSLTFYYERPYLHCWLGKPGLHFKHKGNVCLNYLISAERTGAACRGPSSVWNHVWQLSYSATLR